MTNALFHPAYAPGELRLVAKRLQRAADDPAVDADVVVTRLDLLALLDDYKSVAEERDKLLLKINGFGWMGDEE